GAGTEFGSLEDGNYSLQFNEAAIQGGGPGGPGLSPAGGPSAVQAAQFWRVFGGAHGDPIVGDAEGNAFQAAYPSRGGMSNYRAYLDYAANNLVDATDYYQFLRRRNADGNNNAKGYMLTTAGTIIPVP